MPTNTHELPAEVEDVLDHLDPTTPAKPGVATRVCDGASALPFWPRMEKEIAAYLPSILLVDDPVLVVQGFRGFAACMFHCGRVVGRLEAE